MERLQFRKQRKIINRIIIKGVLILDTPTCLSNGDFDDVIDLVLLRDSIENTALLTGSSIAGALRNYVIDRKEGYQAEDKSILFGCQRSDENGDQSPLIINDALSSEPLKSELRDGVKINSEKRIAAKGQKYDLELLEAGTIFNLCFELLIDEKDNKDQLLEELAIALYGLEKGEISIGMKKHRGFGRCHVQKWQVIHFNMQDPENRTEWLNFEHWHIGLCNKYDKYCSIIDAFTKTEIKFEQNWIEQDKRDRFTIEAKFKLASPLLIRSSPSLTERAPDVVHLKSYRHDKDETVPVLSGTSLAGVLRHRAERILNTLHKPLTILNEIFGTDINNNKSNNAKASRLIVHESDIENTTDLVQTRIAIDRFTGGTYQGALFNEQPIFAQGKKNLTIKLELRNPKDYEIGLLLLLLKDLWTEDLPVGGASSIGRGRLQGIKAILQLKQFKDNKMETHQWIISQLDKKDTLEFEGNEQKLLEKLVKNLVDYPVKEEKQDV